VTERTQRGSRSRSRPLPARTYRGYSATLAPGPFPVRLTRGTTRPCERRSLASTELTYWCLPLPVCARLMPTCRTRCVAAGVSGCLVTVRVEQGGSSRVTFATASRPGPSLSRSVRGACTLPPVSFRLDSGRRRSRHWEDALRRACSAKVKLTRVTPVDPRAFAQSSAAPTIAFQLKVGGGCND